MKPTLSPSRFLRIEELVSDLAEKGIGAREVLDRLNIHVRARRFSCPRHEDVHPSAEISRKYPQNWKCWSCGIYGNQIGLVMFARACTVQAAKDWLGEQFGVQIQVQDGKPMPKAKPLLSPEQQLKNLLEEIGDIPCLPVAQMLTLTAFQIESQDRNEASRTVTHIKGAIAGHLKYPHDCVPGEKEKAWAEALADETPFPDWLSDPDKFARAQYAEYSGEPTPPKFFRKNIRRLLDIP